MNDHLVAAILTMVLKLLRLDPDVVRVHVDAAIVAADKHHLPVELLLGIGYIESNYNANALSRLECVDKVCTRNTKPWTPTTQPPNARPSWFCGPMQSGGNVSWAECQKMRSDIAYGYDVGARELNIWRNVPQCRTLTGNDRMRCALAGYNAGFPGVDIMTTLAYPTKVFNVTEKIRQLAADHKLTIPKS